MALGHDQMILISLDQRCGFGLLDSSLIPPVVPPYAPSVSLQGCFARGRRSHLACIPEGCSVLMGVGETVFPHAPDHESR